MNEHYELTEEDRQAADYWLQTISQRYGIAAKDDDYPTAGPGECDDCHHEHNQRSQYVNVQLCDPCLRLRINTRHYLAHHHERPAQLQHQDTQQPTAPP